MEISFVKNKTYTLDAKDKKHLLNIMDFCIRSSKYFSKAEIKKHGFSYDDATYFSNILIKK